MQRGAVALQVLGHEHLVAVLAAADEVQVGRLGVERLAERSGRSTSSIPRQAQPPAQDLHVAAVGVDREVLGVQLAEHELHAAASSQYGRASPRLAATRCSSSIAV